MKSWGKEFYYLVNCWVTSKWNLQDFLGVEGSVKYRSLQMSAKDQLLTKQKIHSDPVWRRVCNRVLYCSLAGSELIALLPQPPECCTYSWWGKGHHTWTQYFLFFKKKKCGPFEPKHLAFLGKANYKGPSSESDSLHVVQRSEIISHIWQLLFDSQRIIWKTDGEGASKILYLSTV